MLYFFEFFIMIKINGFGFGLVLVVKIIGNYGGVIECDS